MIDQGSRLAVSGGCDQIPDEALDILIPSVMVEAVHQDGSADGFYVMLSELTLVASVGKDVCPSAPAVKRAASLSVVPLTASWSFTLMVNFPR